MHRDFLLACLLSIRLISDSSYGCQHRCEPFVGEEPLGMSTVAMTLPDPRW